MVTFPHFGATGALFMRRRDSPREKVLDIVAMTGLNVVDRPAPGWLGLSITSDTRLGRRTQAPTDEVFTHHFLLRAGQDDRFLLVADAPDVAEGLLEARGLSRHFTSPRIDTGALTRALAAKPGEYAMGAVYARTEGYGSTMRTAVFYGHDLAEALLFIELLPRLSPYRVTLRDVSKRIEVLSVSSRGEVSFNFQGSHSLRNSDRALRFLTGRGFLDWEADAEPRDQTEDRWEP